MNTIATPAAAQSKIIAIIIIANFIFLFFAYSYVIPYSSFSSFIYTYSPSTTELRINVEELLIMFLLIF